MMQPSHRFTDDHNALTATDCCWILGLKYLLVAQVNRSSLLVPEQVAKPQEVNGTNGSAALPVMDTVKQTEYSTESDEEEGGDTDDPGTSKSLVNF